MHSDSWVGVPYEQCPPDVQHNIRVIGRMDAYWEAMRENGRRLAAYVDSLFLGRPIDKPAALPVPAVDDAEMEYMMGDPAAAARKLIDLVDGPDANAISAAAAEWEIEMSRKAKYLAYNRKALEKRYRKGCDQKEIDRVKKLIADGEEEIAFLQPRIDWARSQLS